jgi:PIN domain nuclease of toxin-antitoxin system
MMNRYIIDACALIAYFRKEQGYSVVDSIIEQAKQGEARLYMNRLNLLEVYYDNIRFTWIR